MEKNNFGLIDIEYEDKMKKKEKYDTYELIENLKNKTLNDLMFASLRRKALNDDKYLKKFKFVRLK